MRIEILIIEDELPARRKLKRYLEQLESETVVLAECSTVEEAIVFYSEDALKIKRMEPISPDLIKEKFKNENLKEHILRVGKMFYSVSRQKIKV